MYNEPMNYKICLASLLIAYLAGYGTSRLTARTESKSSTDNVSQIRETEKLKHSVTTIKESKDGSKLTTIDTREELLSQTNTHEEKKTTDTITTNQNQWSISLYRTQTSYIGTLDRRVLGPVFVGAVVSTPAVQLTSPSIGIGLRLEF